MEGNVSNIQICLGIKQCCMFTLPRRFRGVNFLFLWISFLMKSVAHSTDFFSWSLFPPPKNKLLPPRMPQEQSRRRPGQEGNRNSAQPLAAPTCKGPAHIAGKGSIGGYLRLRKLQPKNSLSQRTWAVGSHPCLVGMHTGNLYKRPKWCTCPLAH